MIPDGNKKQTAVNHTHRHSLSHIHTRTHTHTRTLQLKLSVNFLSSMMENLFRHTDTYPLAGYRLVWFVSTTEAAGRGGSQVSGEPSAKSTGNLTSLKDSVWTLLEVRP